MGSNYDFSGWATRNNIKCADGRVITKDAFKHNDGATVPLVWNHQHNDQFNVLGHAVLENREEGVYAYGYLNDTESGRNAKTLIHNGDIVALSIYANQLKQNGSNVVHGAIRELSLVLSGANPGAYIDSIIKHGEEDNESAIIYFDEELDLSHSEEVETKPEEKKEEPKEQIIETNKEIIMSDKLAHAEEKTVQDVFDSMTEEQKNVVYAMIGELLNDEEDDDEEDDDDEGEEEVKYNVFEGDNETNTLMHADIEAIFTDAKASGSFRDTVLRHGITDIDYLFPDAVNMDKTPSLITRPMGWVSKVMNGFHHTPFSRIKSMHANLTEADARAKGYVKGNQKVEEVFGLLKRTTTPTTIYKKQKLDRDDVIDITDFDVVSWLKAEMRLMLDEEIARAALVGDGRLLSSDDKINEQNIRPIWKDDDLYTIKQTVVYPANATEDQKAKAFIRSAVRARKNYKGSGNPTLFTTEDVLTDCLLMEDATGRILYETPEKLATALRVKEVVTVPVMENQTREDGAKTFALLGIIVNLNDYNVGADKGGSVNMFEDFDIDFNQQKYLIETRCSGALTVPYSAIALENEVVVSG